MGLMFRRSISPRSLPAFALFKAHNIAIGPCTKLLLYKPEIDSTSAYPSPRPEDLRVSP